MELDEKRKVCEDSLVGGMSAKENKAINAQIDTALNTLTVIPTITIRSRAKTLRGEQKDISNTFIAVAPAVNESMDISAEAETKFVGAPKEVAEPAVEEAIGTPVNPRAEYGHSPEGSNVSVSDASAESNVSENTETNRRAEKKPAGAEKLWKGRRSGSREKHRPRPGQNLGKHR
jgi:hypothetical protein